ncbi:MAG: ATP-dependent helicase recG, partial [Pseudomonadota bacterium]
MHKSRYSTRGLLFLPMPTTHKKKADSSKSLRVSDRLARLGLSSDIARVLHLPMRYEDETHVLLIQLASRMHGATVQVEGVVSSCDVQYRPRRQLIVKINDDSGTLTLRFLNFYGSQVTQMAVGKYLRVRGEMRHGFFGDEMVHPTVKVVEPGAPLPQALTPVYPAGEGLSQALLRKAIDDAMSRIDWRDTLPESVRNSLQLLAFEPAIRLLHNPPPDIDAYALLDRTHPAWTRVKFDELLAQQLSMKRAQAARRQQGAPALAVVGQLSDALLASLPFTLTDAQQRVLQEIRSDLQAHYPMQRLLQGDVGSGKTV